MIDFIRGNVHPCIYMMQSIKARVYIALYVCENLMEGKPKAKYEVVIDGLQDYLSCEISFMQDKKKAWIGQLYLFEHLEHIYLVSKLWECEVIKPQVYQIFDSFPYWW